MENLKHVLLSTLLFVCLTSFSSKLKTGSQRDFVFKANFLNVKNNTLLDDTTGFKLSPIVDFDAFMTLAAEVQVYRRQRLISLDTFNHWSKMPNTVILDTRSDSLYNGKHINGAIHLDFSNFTQESLAAIIPDKNTRILIYCNNNFKALRLEPAYFVSKAIRPNFERVAINAIGTAKPLSLALNIPTFINLYGYGYKNIYELGEQLYVFDSRLQFEGTGEVK